MSNLTCLLVKLLVSFKPGTLVIFFQLMLTLLFLLLGQKPKMSFFSSYMSYPSGNPIGCLSKYIPKLATLHCLYYSPPGTNLDRLLSWLAAGVVPQGILDPSYQMFLLSLAGSFLECCLEDPDSFWLSLSQQMLHSNFLWNLLTQPLMFCLPTPTSDVILVYYLLSVFGF